MLRACSAFALQVERSTGRDRLLPSCYREEDDPTTKREREGASTSGKTEDLLPMSRKYHEPITEGLELGQL